MQKIQIRLGARFGQEEKRVMSTPRRDAIVVSAALRLIIPSNSSGTARVPFRKGTLSVLLQAAKPQFR
jgi:hypothetical protein